MEHVEQLLALSHLRCPIHGMLPMVQRANGEIRFWCGCVRHEGECRDSEERDSRTSVPRLNGPVGKPRDRRAKSPIIA
jgi:hypothetical protein